VVSLPGLRRKNRCLRSAADSKRTFQPVPSRDPPDSASTAEVTVFALADHPEHPAIAAQHDLGGVSGVLGGSGDPLVGDSAELAFGDPDLAGQQAEPLAVGDEDRLVEAELFFEFLELLFAQPPWAWLEVVELRPPWSAPRDAS
jgi:hypothetical protein